MKINKPMCGEDMGDVTGELNQSSMVVGGGGGSARLDLSNHGILSYHPPGHVLQSGAGPAGHVPQQP
jgi:hypothetical protein